MSPFNTVEFKRYAAQVVKAHSSGTLSGSDKEKLAKMTDVLTTLEFLRKTLLQDVAVILDKHPDHIIGYMSPFNTVEFKRYAAQVVKAHSSGTLSGSDKEKLAKMTDVLTTLEFLRKTLLQDVAVILDKHPDHIIGYMSPFNTVEFKRYAAQVVKAHSSGTLSGSDKEKLAKMTDVLTTLEFLRKTLLQDVAVILDKHPDHIIGYMSPFNTVEFKRYAAQVVKAHSSGTLSGSDKEKLAKMTAVLGETGDCFSKLTEMVHDMASSQMQLMSRMSSLESVVDRLTKALNQANSRHCSCHDCKQLSDIMSPKEADVVTAKEVDVVDGDVIHKQQKRNDGSKQIVVYEPLLPTNVNNPESLP
ncbi:unnamed protein product [Ambrosiozyma monospora]|uniref:Unnamed protein product n=1 Tax=Ambrosiozyma monospora TaxID=43982 RepID=A0A9W6T5X3_AMBMO|nr:unnamed protein product [Ambrosiozyma monospora]